VIQVTKRLRDDHLPAARCAILSNSLTVGSRRIQQCLAALDLKIMKFDAGSEEMFRRLNHPGGPVYMREIIAGLKELDSVFLQRLMLPPVSFLHLKINPVIFCTAANSLS
jgi:wyosine [tRNA(Phe)-imidazoG37] synthetase (radical SAM superfamily)